MTRVILLLLTCLSCIGEIQFGLIPNKDKSVLVLWVYANETWELMWSTDLKKWEYLDQRTPNDGEFQFISFFITTTGTDAARNVFIKVIRTGVKYE